MFKSFDFLCEKCGIEYFDKLVDKNEVPPCEKCGGKTIRLWSRANLEKEDDHNIFKPFWSDTFTMRVKDRIDLQKIKELRKKHGLECVGHYTQTPDRKAIRINYESD